MPVLFRAQNIARTADFEVAHGDTEARAELGELADGFQPLLRRLGQTPLRADGEVRIRLPVAPPDAPAQLIELAQPEAIRVKDNQRIRRRHVQAAFDDGRAEQHVVAAAVEVHHHVLQAVFAHLPVRHADARFRHKLLQALIERADGLHRVIEEVHLSPARHLAQNRVANHAVVVVNHACLHRQSFLRRRFQHRHIADADHRHVQRARNRRGGERQHIHLMLHVLDDFLMLHAKSLLLVHNQQTEVLELHVFAQNAVRTDKDVDFALLHAAQNVLGFLRRAEAAQHVHLDREALEALQDRVVVLLRQNRRRRQNRNLLGVHQRLERCTQADLRLAVADVAAQQPVHVARRFHVRRNFLHALLLIRGQLVGEHVLKLALPRRIRAERKARLLRPPRIELHKVKRHLFQALFDLRLLLLPVAAAELVQLRGIRRIADVALHTAERLNRHIELVAPLILDLQIIPARAAVFHLRCAKINADAMFLVHHEVAGLQVSERGNLFTRRLPLLRLAVARTVHVRVADDNQARFFPDEAVRQRAGQHLHTFFRQLVDFLRERRGDIVFFQRRRQTLTARHAAAQHRHAAALAQPAVAVLRQRANLRRIPCHALHAKISGILDRHACHAFQKLRLSDRRVPLHMPQQLVPVHQQGFLLLDGFVAAHRAFEILREARPAFFRALPEQIRVAQHHNVRLKPVQHRVSIVRQHGQPRPNALERQPLRQHVRVRHQLGAAAFQFRLARGSLLLFANLRGDVLIEKVRRVRVILRQRRQIRKERRARGRQVAPLPLDGVPHPPRCLFRLRRWKQYLRRGRERAFLHRIKAALADAVEFADGVHLVVEELNAQTLAARRRVHVDDAAAQGALPLALHHADALVAHGGQAADEVIQVDSVAGSKANRLFAEAVGAAHALQGGIHTRAEQADIPLLRPCQRFQPPPRAFVARRAAREVNFAARQTRHARFQQLLTVLGVVRRLEVVAGNQQDFPARIGAEF